MKPTSLLRWYPRAWRERYGEELLALIHDTLDEGRPTWRLRLSVAWGGVRERGHQAGHVVSAAVKPPAGPERWAPMLVAGLIAADLPASLKEAASRTRGWPATAAFDAVLAAVALTGAVVLVGGLVALPTLVRFLRAGGWPKIRRRVAWAAGVTVIAGGGLAALASTPAAVASGSVSFTQLDAPWAYLIGFFATGLALAAAIGLWAIAATVTARHLTLAPRVRAAQLVLGAVAPAAVTGTLITLSFWWSATQTPFDLVWVVLVLVPAIISAWQRIPRAARQGKRLRAAASGAVIVNPSAAREHGRHRG
jgi:hypothetical protein